MHRRNVIHIIVDIVVLVLRFLVVLQLAEGRALLDLVYFVLQQHVQQVRDLAVEGAVHGVHAHSVFEVVLPDLYLLQGFRLLVHEVLDGFYVVGFVRVAVAVYLFLVVVDYFQLLLHEVVEHFVDSEALSVIRNIKIIINVIWNLMRVLRLGSFGIVEIVEVLVLVVEIFGRHCVILTHEVQISVDISGVI